MVPWMDKELADNILAIDTEVLDYQMCDILDKEERKALADRIKGVQRIIRKTMNEEERKNAMGHKAGSSFLEGEESWTEALNDYMKEIKVKADKDKDDIETFLDTTSYLDINMMYG